MSETIVHTLGCHRSYCSCSLFPMVSNALLGLRDNGSGINKPRGQRHRNNNNNIIIII